LGKAGVVRVRSATVGWRDREGRGRERRGGESGINTNRTENGWKSRLMLD